MDLKENITALQFITKSQAVGRIADHTASQKTIASN